MPPLFYLNHSDDLDLLTSRSMHADGLPWIKPTDFAVLDSSSHFPFEREQTDEVKDVAECPIHAGR